MDYKQYISALEKVIPYKEKYAPSYLDAEIISRTDRTILRRLLDYEMENGSFSVYKIYSYFKKALMHPKSYKNTHQWIQRLYSLGMIEEVYGNYARGARFYRISTGGWLNLILDATFRYTGYEQALIKFYDQNIFFKTFVLPYFEIDTVKTLKTGLGLDLYLINCCEATILWLEEVDREWLTEELQSEEELEIWDLDLEVKAFFYKSIVEITKKLSIDYYHPGVRKELIDTLSRDIKFLEAIKVARNEFDSSYERLYHELT
jgi:hypothetical protein